MSSKPPNLKSLLDGTLYDLVDKELKERFEPQASAVTCIDEFVAHSKHHSSHQGASELTGGKIIEIFGNRKCGKSSLMWTMLCSSVAPKVWLHTLQVGGYGDHAIILDVSGKLDCHGLKALFHWYLRQRLNSKIKSSIPLGIEDTITSYLQTAQTTTATAAAASAASSSSSSDTHSDIDENCSEDRENRELREPHFQHILAKVVLEDEQLMEELVNYMTEQVTLFRPRDPIALMKSVIQMRQLMCDQRLKYDKPVRYLFCDDLHTMLDHYHSNEMMKMMDLSLKILCSIIKRYGIVCVWTRGIPKIRFSEQRLRAFVSRSIHPILFLKKYSKSMFIEKHLLSRLTDIRIALFNLFSPHITHKDHVLWHSSVISTRGLWECYQIIKGRPSDSVRNEMRNTVALRVLSQSSSLAAWTISDSTVSDRQLLFNNNGENQNDDGSSSSARIIPRSLRSSNMHSQNQFKDIRDSIAQVLRHYPPALAIPLIKNNRLNPNRGAIDDRSDDKVDEDEDEESKKRRKDAGFMNYNIRGVVFDNHQQFRRFKFESNALGFARTTIIENDE